MPHINNVLFLRSVINHIDDPVFVKDESHAWVLVNEAFARLLGVDSWELIGKTDYDFLNKHDSDIYWEKDSEVFRSGKLNVNVEPMVGLDGVERVIKTKKTLLVLGETKYLVGVISDLTQERELTEALKKSQQKAIKANKAKSDFLANMSHELRTPIHSVISFTDLLLKKEENKERVEMLEAIKSSGKLLGSIINDILDISKIESGYEKLTLRRLNVDDLVSSVAKTLEPLLKENNNTLVTRLDSVFPEFVGDGLKLQQVLTNLISNSAKFTQNGEVILRVSLLESSGSEVRLQFSVADTGDGIEEAFMDELFNKFTQQDSGRTKEKQGSGLGLAIVKSYVELMGGEISVRSTVNKGTVFSFYICLKKMEEEKLISSVNSKGGFRGLGDLKLLVAEDNELNQMLMSKILDYPNITLKIVDNGAKAVSEAKKTLYDAVILDIHMPVLDGIGACKEIKRLPKYKDKPIIALTANVTTGMIKEVEQLGMIYCSKPIDLDVLYNALRTVKK